MNKIYSLKYSHITGGLVAVSELTRKVSVGTSRKKVILGIILSSIYGSYGETAFAAMLDINNIWTRDYLDLAQNRGEFRPGATNVQLMMKDGKMERYFIFQNYLYLIFLLFPTKVQQHQLEVRTVLLRLITVHSIMQ